MGEASNLDNVPRAFMPDLSADDLDSKQEAISTRRRQGGPELDDPSVDEPEDDDAAERGFFIDPEVPATDLEDLE